MISFLKKKKGTLIMCEKCACLFVDYGDVVKTKLLDGRIKVEYEVICQECGATGKITEMWG